jgi:hypothetical protein
LSGLQCIFAGIGKVERNENFAVLHGICFKNLSEIGVHQNLWFDDSIKTHFPPLFAMMYFMNRIRLPNLSLAVGVRVVLQPVFFSKKENHNGS